jgi:hypothetical protein
LLSRHSTTRAHSASPSLLAITLIVFHMLNHPYTPGMDPTWMQGMIPLICPVLPVGPLVCCWWFLHHYSEALWFCRFSFGSAFIWFWHHSHASFIKWVWKCSLLFFAKSLRGKGINS